MKFTFIKSALLSISMLATSFANAGLIQSGTGVDIPAYTVSYQTFVLAADADITLDITIFGNDNNTDTINFFLFDGTFGNLGSIFDQNSPTTYTDYIPSLTSTVSLTQGAYTYAFGSNYLSEDEARSGSASTPYQSGVTYDYSITSSTDIPEPSTLAIFALGLLGLASRRVKK